MVRAGGGDEGIVWRDLLYMGYNDRLKLVGARTIVVSVHATKEVGSPLCSPRVSTCRLRCASVRGVCVVTTPTAVLSGPRSFQTLLVAWGAAMKCDPAVYSRSCVASQG
jgi:hypothetical protein